MKAVDFNKTISTTSELFLINNSNVDGRIVIAAFIELLNLNEAQTRHIILNAHTKGFVSLGMFSNAVEFKNKFHSYMKNEGYFQNLIVDGLELMNVKIEAQKSNDLVRKTRILPQYEEISLSKSLKRLA
jgi:hypothetical protein